jgi:Xaa-Pro aminopeptidase
MRDKRQRIDANIHQAMVSQGCDAVVTVGSDNFTYMTGVCLPFATHFPDRMAFGIRTKERQDWIFCPRDWEEAIQDQGWRERILPYSEMGDLPHGSAIESLARALEDLDLQKGSIGIDHSRVSFHLMDQLTRRLPQVNWTTFDDFFRALRLEKTPEEIELIETASKHSELGIIGALNHMEGSMDEFGYTLSEFSERIRVHAFEAGASGVGHVATLQGVECQQWYAPPQGKFRPDHLVRMELTTHFSGYWSNAARMAFMGQPTQREKESYLKNLYLKQAAEEMFKPEIHCDEIFGQVKRTAEKEKIDFWEDGGVGHGVGVSEREAPYLNPADRTILKPGMVLVLAIYSYGPDRQLICSKDTYEILPTGFRLLSWYRNWDRLYAVIGFRAAH